MGNLEIQDELGNITRRLSSVEKRLDLLNADREILEDLVARLTALEEQTRLSRQNDETIRKDLKEEIQMAGDRIENTVAAEIQKKVKTVTKHKWLGIFKRG